MTRTAGRLLMAIAVIHALFGLWFGRGPLLGIARDGFLNAIDPFPDRQLVFWFLFASPMLWLLGQLVSWTAERGAPPTFLGWGLLLLVVVCGAMMPASGFWLALAPAGMLVSASRRGRIAGGGNAQRAGRWD